MRRRRSLSRATRRRSLAGSNEGSVFPSQTEHQGNHYADKNSSKKKPRCFWQGYKSQYNESDRDEYSRNFSVHTHEAHRAWMRIGTAILHDLIVSLIHTQSEELPLSSSTSV